LCFTMHLCPLADPWFRTNWQLELYMTAESRSDMMAMMAVGSSG
jgi:hypothetical protein